MSKWNGRGWALAGAVGAALAAAPALWAQRPAVREAPRGAEVEAAVQALEATAAAHPALAMETMHAVRALDAARLAAPASLGALDGLSARVERDAFDAPPEAWAQEDPADSLYRAARSALNGGDYKRAADLFARIISRFPRSTYTPDAYYWRAFALYRVGGREDLEQAQRLLATQRQQHPRAATRGDADALVVRINGQLAQQGDARSAERVVREATQSGPCEDAEIKVAALNALMQMDAERAMPILKKVLERRDACSAELRKKAVFIVADKRTPEATDILLSVVRSDPDRRVREQAVFWLGETRSPRAVDALEGLLQRSQDEGIRKKAIFALSQTRSDRSRQVLREFVERESNPVDLRAEAIFWLADQQKTPENAAYLRSLYGKVSDRRLKEKLFFALAQMKGQGNDRWLMDVAMNGQEDVRVRKQALFWAAEGGAPIAELVRLYDRATDAQMKEQLIFVYSQRREDAALEKLLQIARTEKNPALRKKAIFWLGESKDPRALDFLAELIGQ